MCKIAIMPRTTRTVEIPLINLHRDQVAKELEELNRLKKGLQSAFKVLMEEGHKADIEFTNLSVLVAAEQSTSEKQLQMGKKTFSEYGEPSSITCQQKLNLNPNVTPNVVSNSEEEFDSE